MRWVSTSVRTTTAPIDQMAHANCNDQIAARAFGATRHLSPVIDLEKHADEYDAVFATQWKVRSDFETRWMDVLHRLKDAGKTVVLFQEAETSWPMTRSWEEIQSLIQLLGKIDLFLTHNDRDVRSWGTMCRASVRWKTCLDLSFARQFVVDPAAKTDRPILFGSSYDGRANGLTGLLAARKFGNPLWHQNRSTGYADRNRELPNLLGVQIAREIPHEGWVNWMKDISGAYIAVHPMPAAAAGRDQLAFAALGIPCIGNPELDIQRELFPNLVVADLYEPAIFQEVLADLLNDHEHYASCRARAMQRVDAYDLPAAAPQAQRIKEMMGWR